MKEMKRILLTTFLLLITLWVGAAEFDKATYYSAANNTCGATLKTKMCGIISAGASMLSYSGVWTAFATTDVRSDGYIWDRYCNTNMSYGTNQDTGSGGTEEGQFYNREHSFPKSWFGGSTSAGPGTDLHHVVAADKFGNSKRGNRMYGVVMSNVSKLSNSRYGKGGYGSRTNYDVFEPAEEYKGDFARTYFYMVTMYENSIVSWYNNYGSEYDSGKILDGNKYPGIQDWYMTMLLAWAESDPVDSREENRNNAVYAKQNNRNPFIDFPGLEQYIWGTLKTTNVSISNYVDPYNGTPPTPTPSITLSPTTATIEVGASLTLTATTQNATGATVTWTSSNTSVATVTGGTVTALAEGTATITAKITVSGTTYSATCYVTVTRNETPPVVEGDSYVKVTSNADLTDGQYLIVCEEGSLAFNGGLEKLDAASNGIAVSIADNKIEVTGATEAAEFTLDIVSGTIKSASGLYVGNASNSNSLTAQANPLANTITVSEDEATILSSGGAYLRFNAAENQMRFRYYKSSSYTGQKPIQLYKKVATETTVLLGDVNRDGYVTIADVTALVNIILGKATEGDSNNYDFKAADVNEDEDITIADVTALVNLILHKE